MTSVNKRKALVDTTMINRDISDLRCEISDLKSTTIGTTDIIADTRATVSSMATTLDKIIQRVVALEAKVNRGHKAPTHWEGKL